MPSKTYVILRRCEAPSRRTHFRRPRLMHRQGMVDVAEAVGEGAAALLHVDRVELALDVLSPEFEELAQLGKIRGEIKFLPNEALQQGRMVGQPVDYLGG